MKRNLGIYAAALAAASMAPNFVLRPSAPVTEVIQPKPNTPRKARGGKNKRLPHQGEREMSRRRRQIANGQLSFRPWIPRNSTQA